MLDALLNAPDDDAIDALLETAARARLASTREQLDRYLPFLLDDPDEWAHYSSLWRDQWLEDGGYLRFPDLWVVDQLGEVPWSGQREIMRSVFANRKTAVVSSFGVGKDWTAARIIACFLDQHPPGDAFVVSTAPTFAQVRAILWREVGIAFVKANETARREGRASLADRGHRLNLTEWWIGKELVGFGRKPGVGNSAAFQGIHARMVLVVLDEAGGVPEDLFEDAEKLVTTERSRILAIGNATHEATYWHKVCNDPDWHRIHISAFDTPNFTGEPIPAGVAELLTSQLWVDEQRRRYGESSPRYQQQVLARFTKDRTMTTIPLDWARATIHAERYGPAATAAHERALVEQGPRTLGVDVGAGGADWTVIRERVGNRAGRQWRIQTGEPKEQVALVSLAAFEARVQRIVIDSVGVGYGLVELIRQAVPYAEIIAAEAGEASDVVRTADGRTAMVWDVPSGVETQPVFLNKRAEWWWAARERSMLAADNSYQPIVPYARPWDLTALEYDTVTGDPLAEDDPTLDELTTPGYEHVTRGKTTVVKVEAKEELRKSARLGSSTDHADALILAFLEPGRTVAPPQEYGGMSVPRATPQPRSLTTGDGRGGLSGGGTRQPLVRRQ
jgi:hypothetical protein